MDVQRGQVPVAVAHSIKDSPTRMSEQRIKALVEFRLQGLRPFPQFRNDGPARAVVDQVMREAYTAAEDTGQVLFLERGGEVVAGWLWWERVHPTFGIKVPEFILEFDTAHPEAMLWVRDLLRSRRFRFPENTTSVLPARYAFLIPELAVAGLAIDSVELIGHCQQGLHVIGEPLSPLPYGLAWKPLRTKEDLYGALGLRRRVFEANPEYAWFATNPEHAVRFKQRLEEEMQGEHLWHVLVKHGQVLGFYGSSVVKENPFWGPRGGVEFVLDPKLQGRGIGKEAYRRTLQGLIQKGCPVYMGTTANPAVLNLAAKLGREMVRFNVRAGGTLTQRHFELFV